MAKNSIFSGLGEDRRTPRATSPPVEHGSTWYLRGRHQHSPALPDTNRVGRGLLLCRDRRPIVALAVFDQCVDNFQRESAKVRRAQQREQIILEEQTFFPCSPWQYDSILSRFLFWIVWKENFATSRFHCHRSYEANQILTTTNRPRLPIIFLNPKYLERNILLKNTSFNHT